MTIVQNMGCDFNKMLESEIKGNVCQVCHGNGTIIGTGVVSAKGCRCCSGKGYHETAPCEYNMFQEEK